MSKVVLVAINAKYVHSSLSVWVIAAGVLKYARLPHDVRVVEATINQSCASVVDAVAVHKPDVIGISTYIWNAGKLSELLGSLRTQLPDTLIVLGGPEASNNMDYWLKSNADHVMCGEGEYCFPQFLDKYDKKKHIESFSSSSPSDADYDAPVDPYTSAYFDALDGRLAYIETSRGCPYHCTFCLSAGSVVRYFPLDSVKKQILKLSQSNTKTIKFVDRTFNCNSTRAYELFEYVIGLDASCRFHFEVAADLFDECVFSLLKTAPPGCIQFEIGLQSFHEPALKASSRQMDMEKAEQNIRTLLDMQNIHIHIDLIAGLPFETSTDFMSSFDRAYSLSAHTLQLGFLKLLHGCELRTQAEVLGLQYMSEPPYEIVSSPWMSADDILTLKKAENALQNTRNKGRFLSTLDYVLSATGMRPFALMNSLGTAAPNHGTQLENYATQVYDFCTSLPGVDSEALKDYMVFDWLGMVKGKNTPPILKNNDINHRHIAEKAEKMLGRMLRREEIAVLRSGKGVFVDSNDRDPVTGLYRVYKCE